MHEIVVVYGAILDSSLITKYACAVVFGAGCHDGGGGEPICSLSIRSAIGRFRSLPTSHLLQTSFWRLDDRMGCWTVNNSDFAQNTNGMMVL